MTPSDFRKNYSDQLQTILQSPCGSHLVATLGAMRPAYEFSVQNHLLAENRGAMRGYELCLRNLLGLAQPFTVQREPEPNYGVPSVATQNV